jgi:glycosyltransferase involved in cell wall biosynthesis
MASDSERRRIVFVTQELDPFVPGGAGAVVAGLATDLAVVHHVTVILASAGPGGEVTTPFGLVTVDPGEPDGSADWFIERSRRAGLALARLVSDEAVDLVEFCDFEGLAFWSLLHRAELGLEATRLAVRLHGPVNALAMDGAFGPTRPAPPVDTLGLIERLVLVMADAVIVPSPEVGEWAVATFGIEAERLVVGPPPVPAVTPVEWSPRQSPHFVSYGRLTEQKGTHDLVRAMVPVLDRYPDATLDLIGPDGWSREENRPMSEVVRELVPARHRDRVSLVGAMARDDALGSISTALAVVIPSRYESFCLAAHEARRAGLPVVVPAMAPFAPYEVGSGLLVYDGSVEGLTRCLLDLIADPAIAARLVTEPAPRVGNPLAAYEGRLPDPRHPNSQAGLATMAGKRLEELDSAPPGRVARMATAVMRWLPRPLAAVALRLVPPRLKDRFRSVASWPAEVERREREAAAGSVRTAIAAGRFSEVPDPRVSVVIPCFDQGEWVEEAVASVFRQTFSSWEIVLVDDGSTHPATVAALDRLARWPRVSLVRQDNAGLPAARNAGMRVASGEFVVPLDADDELTPEFMSQMVAALEARPDAAFAHCWSELFGDVAAIWVPRPYNRYWQRLSNGIVGCVLLRRSAWQAVGGYDESMRSGHEDWELWLRLDAAGWDQVQVRQPLFRYRKHGISMSVQSEAGFERGAAQIRDRHPDLYAPGVLGPLKTAAYPYLSLVAAAGTPTAGEDVEVVADPTAAVGKFVAVWKEGDGLDQVLAAADRLEHAATRAFAVSGTGTTVWRRWCLVDPNAEPRGGVGGESAAPDGWINGQFPDPDWTVDRSVVPAGLALMRQRPEETGPAPWRTR